MATVKNASLSIATDVREASFSISGNPKRKLQYKRKLHKAEFDEKPASV